MKKNLIITATGVLSACVLLTGCTVTPKVNVSGNVNVNGSEVFSEEYSYEPGTISGVTVTNGKGGNLAEDGSETKSETEGQFPGGLDDDGRDPSEIGQFPGGLDDDGPGADEAVSVLFEREANAENATEKAIISGLNMAGGRVWTYETKEDYIGQVDGLQEVDYFDGKYVFVAFGEVICLDVSTGKELWVNKDFKGHGISWATNDKQDKLYMCGYFGPDLFVMDLDGKTLNRIMSKNEDNYWAYKVEYVSDNQVKVTYESTEKTVTYDPNGPKEQ